MINNINASKVTNGNARKVFIQYEHKIMLEGVQGKAQRSYTQEEV